MIYSKMWMVGGAAALYLISPLIDPYIRLFHQDNAIAGELLKAVPSLQGKFWPTPWLANGHLQSLYAVTLGGIGGPNVHYSRELVKLSDGGTLSIDWANDQLADVNRVMIIFHGLTGGSEQLYVRTCVSQALSRGYRVGVMQMRGINGTPMTSCKLANAGVSEDLREGLEVVHRHYPTAKIAAIGMSMGANLVLKYAGESQQSCLLSAAVAISCPFDLLQCCQTLRQFQFRLSDKMLTSNLKALIRANYAVISQLQGTNGIDMDRVQAATSVYEFDDLLTRRALGLGSVEEYYQTSSCTRVLSNIRIPTLAINALDDPVTT